MNVGRALKSIQDYSLTVKTSNKMTKNINLEIKAHN